MSWKLRLIDAPVNVGDTSPGDCWYAPWLIEGADDVQTRHPDLSPEYWQDWYGKRAPLYVRLPGGRTWLIDCRFSGEGHDLKENGWTITGEVPNLTAQPSINATGSYHGWLKNGELSDDCEGRKFP